VIFTALVQILGSAFVLLMSVSTLLAPALVRNAQTPKPPTPIPVFYGLAAIYGLFAVFGLLTAVGLFRMQRWARYSTLAFSPLPLLIGLIMATLFLFMPLRPPGLASGPETDAAMKFARVALVSLGVFLALIGTSWLIYFNRPKVKLAFQGGAGESTAVAEGVRIGGQYVPLSITIIAGFSLFGALFCIPLALMPIPLVLFGLVLKGAAGSAVKLIIGAVQAYIGMALLKLQDRGRLVAIALESFWLANGAFVLLLPTARLQRLSREMNQWLGSQQPSLPEPTNLLVMRLVMAAGIAIPVVILYFLITRSWAFRKGAGAKAITA
jgi:hypothetical protein